MKTGLIVAAIASLIVLVVTVWHEKSLVAHQATNPACDHNSGDEAYYFYAQRGFPGC